jgi:hypothetical protein
MSKEGTLARNNYFKPSPSKEESVMIPGHWVDFFTVRLLSLEYFN